MNMAENSSSEEKLTAKSIFSILLFLCFGVVIVQWINKYVRLLSNVKLMIEFGLNKWQYVSQNKTDQLESCSKKRSRVITLASSLQYRSFLSLSIDHHRWYFYGNLKSIIIVIIKQQQNISTLTRRKNGRRWKEKEKKGKKKGKREWNLLQLFPRKKLINSTNY